ncbi:hypothetical protein BDZ97DRAFT_1922705 [Flammula alnicola]|nr:hypothetical protein BDZ97DRAFT_1922705 [Flammula alnicola]
MAASILYLTRYTGFKSRLHLYLEVLAMLASGDCQDADNDVERSMTVPSLHLQVRNFRDTVPGLYLSPPPSH